MEVDVDALVARGVDVGKVRGDRLLASGRAFDGLLEGQLGGVVELHGYGTDRGGRGGRPWPMKLRVLVLEDSLVIGRRA
jgi:hypothetical protein